MWVSHIINNRVGTVPKNARLVNLRDVIIPKIEGYLKDGEAAIMFSMASESDKCFFLQNVYLDFSDKGVIDTDLSDEMSRLFISGTSEQVRVMMCMFLYLD